MPDGSTLMVKQAKRDGGAQAGSAGAGRIVLGAIAGAHGVRGLVKLKSFTDVPEDMLSFGPLRFGAAGRDVTVTHKGMVKGLLLAAIEGVADRNAADALRGTELTISRDRLPALVADEDGEDFYVADLIGLNAVDPDGGVLGGIVAVHDFGAGDMLEVAPEGSARGGRETFYVPFTREAVPDVDLVAGKVTVSMPDELVAGEDRDD